MYQESIKNISKIIWNDFKYNRALFAISSLWLWHATRTLAVIDYYTELGFSITIISYGNALSFLKKELQENTNITFIELEDYPAIERWTWVKFYWYLVTDLLAIDILIWKEYKFVKNMWDNFDFIFSDWKYWVYSKNVPSFLLTHQIAFILPKKLVVFSDIINYFNYRYFKKFSAIIIPDYKDKKKSLAWKLSHTKFLKDLNHHYIWPLTSYSNLKEVTQDIDYYFIISWYLQEHKQSFINKLIDEAKKLDWKKVFVLWDTSKNDVIEMPEYDIIIYSNVSSNQRLDFFNRAKIIISRAGYTTIMDLVANNKKAVLFPTKNQTEQEYLADYLGEKGFFVNWWENDFDLKKLISKI